MKNKKGFTLIEVIISIAALGIICAILLRLFVLAGDTNKRAGNIQDAQMSVTSTVELFSSAESIEEAMTALGIGASDGTADGSYTFIQDDYKIIVDISEDTGGYPGRLFDLSVKAVDDEKELASIDTSKYYGVPRDDQ